MKKLTSLLAFVLFVGLTGFAQTKTGKISGSVLDGSKKTVESATISLLRAKDSSVVKFSVADKAGKFEFTDVPEGKYLVLVSAVGHSKAYSETVEVGAGKSPIVVKTLELVPEAKSISGVTVTAKKPLIEQKIDRTVVNVEASPTNAGNSALEVLEKSPGITVDKDGNISLKGKEGVMVLVDGRPTQLSNADLANLLRSMQASQLDQIEIMTNPPARYDAAGNAGIINIKTKKNKQFGYNGSVTLGYGQGRYPKINEGVNFNYRKGKVNLFTNLSHNYRQSFNALDIQRNMLNHNSKELEYYFDQQARMKHQSNSYNGKLGLDYSPSKNTTLGVVVGSNQYTGDGTNRNITNISNASGQLLEVTRARSGSDTRFKNFSTNLNFRQVLDTAGKELTADLDYITYNTKDNQFLSNYYFDATGKEIRKGDTLYSTLPQDIQIWSGRADYIHPLKKGARFEAGLKSSLVKTDNNASFDTVHNGQVLHDYNRSNHFVYEENINAAYVNLSTPLSKKLSAQLGLRLENTVAKGNQFSTGESFKRNYTNLFPTAYFQYAVNQKNNLGLNYGRRIRRPNYESLNPFIEYLDRYTYQQGNPNLKPQFSHNVELSHTYRNFLTTTLNYTRTNDIIQQVIEQNTERKETYVKQANIARQRQLGISVNAGFPLTKWWTSNLYINASNNIFEGMVNNEPVTVKASMLMLNGSQQFKINKTLSAELSGFYRTAGLEGVILTRPVGVVSLGVSKQIMKNNGTLRLNIRDLFYTQKFKAETKYGMVDARFQEWRDSRVVNLSFTYRFNKGKMNGNGQKKRNGSANEEQSRVGGAGGN